MDLFFRQNLNNFLTISLIKFLYPLDDLANKGNLPIEFSIEKLICVPIIGCVPDLLIFSANSNAPHKFKLSQIPILGILFSLQYWLNHQS